MGIKRGREMVHMYVGPCKQVTKLADLVIFFDFNVSCKIFTCSIDHPKLGS